MHQSLLYLLLTNSELFKTKHNFQGWAELRQGNHKAVVHPLAHKETPKEVVHGGHGLKKPRGGDAESSALSVSPYGSTPCISGAARPVLGGNSESPILHLFWLDGQRARWGFSTLSRPTSVRKSGHISRRHHTQLNGKAAFKRSSV